MDDTMKPGRLSHDMRRAKNDSARTSRKKTKEDCLAAATAACKAANKNPGRARPHLEHAVASLPGSYRIITTVGRKGIDRTEVVHKSEVPTGFATMGCMPLRRKKKVIS